MKYQVIINNEYDYKKLCQFMIKTYHYWINGVDDESEFICSKKKIYVIFDSFMYYVSYTYTDYNYELYKPYYEYKNSLREQKLERILNNK